MPNYMPINIMFADPICRLAFFIQFRRLVKLSVNLTEIRPARIQDVGGMLANNKEFFQGPFVVSDQFFLFLFLKGILQPKLVDSFFKFGLKCNDTGSSTAGDGSQPSNSLDDVQNTFLESQAESLVRLFFFRGSPESISRILKEDFEHCSYKLDFVKMQDDTSIDYIQHLIAKTTLWALTILVTIMQRHKVLDLICGLMMDFKKLYTHDTTYGFGTYGYGEDYSVGTYNPRYHYAASQSAGFDLRTDDGLPKTIYVGNLDLLVTEEFIATLFGHETY
uniref:Uncharacterized protein n=1 Tax=Meloidogyne incognita TaxID=6306 RepID=A0A914LUI9_MELIC